MAFCQPVLRSRNPVLNSASYRTPGLPGSGIARGSIFSVIGTGLGSSNWVKADYPVPTELGGSKVTVTVGTTVKQAYILFAYTYQINAVLPSDTPTGAGTITVSYNGQTSAPAEIQVVDSAFGIYTAGYSGAGQAIATDPNYNVNSIIQAFHPGDYAVLWGTGLGGINAPDDHPAPMGDLPGSIKVHVGNSLAPITYAGRAPCCSGLDQIVLQIPPDVKPGCSVPVAVETGGGVSNMTTIAVSASGKTCTDSVMGQDLVNQLAAGQSVSFGYVRLENLIARFIPTSAAQAQVDIGYATFSKYTPQTASRAVYGVSPGYCMAVDCSAGCAVNGYNGSLADLSPSDLDAGTNITVQGQGSIAMPRNGSLYAALLNANSQRFLWGGLQYDIAASGGKDVGAFSSSTIVGIPSGLDGVQFTGIRSGDSLPLSGDLKLTWTGGDPSLQNGQVTIGAYSGNNDLTKWVWLQCVAPVADKQFTIPGWVLSTLPRTGSGTTPDGIVSYPQGWLWIGQYKKPVEFKADKLTRGIYTDIFATGFGVYFQ